MKNYQGYNNPLEDLVGDLSTSEDEYPAPAAAGDAAYEEQPMVTANESDSDSFINPIDHAPIGGSSSKSPKGSKRRLTPANQNNEIRGEQFWI